MKKLSSKDTIQRPYYEAYDERYRQIHSMGLQWFYDAPAKIVTEVMDRNGITKTDPILELGCGEGRDAFPLLQSGYDLLATDVSAEAIAYCRKRSTQYAQRFQVLDCVGGRLDRTFRFLYAVAVIHMLVEDSDRDGFWQFIRRHLSSGGKALVLSMGDGTVERSSDVTTAFCTQERIHEQSGKQVQVAGTSCRMVSWQTMEKEICRNGLAIVEKGLTPVEPDFNEMMYFVVECVN